MANARYSKDHEWIQLDGDVATVGITNYAQSKLADMVRVDLPKIGTRVTKGDEAAVVESVKAASEIHAPASGEVVAVNEMLEAAPDTVNQDAEGAGWFFKLKLADVKELDDLMSAHDYQLYLETLA